MIRKVINKEGKKGKRMHKEKEYKEVNDNICGPTISMHETQCIGNKVEE